MHVCLGESEKQKHFTVGRPFRLHPDLLQHSGCSFIWYSCQFSLDPGLSFFACCMFSPRFVALSGFSVPPQVVHPTRPTPPTPRKTGRSCKCGRPSLALFWRGPRQECRRTRHNIWIAIKSLPYVIAEQAVGFQEQLEPDVLWCVCVCARWN